MKCLFIILFFLLLPVMVSGQSDSSYVRAFDQEFSIRALVYRKFTAIEHEISKNESVTYEPNTPIGIGFGITYKEFSLTGGIAFDFLRDKNLGKTRSLDFQYHYYGERFLADVFFQQYKGYYVLKEDDPLQVDLYPDISVTQYGFLGHYVFNHKKFSYPAAFYQTKRQLKSAGSFQVGGGFYYNRLSADSSLVINTDNRHSNYQININGGYAHTFVIKRDFFVSFGLSAGISLGAASLNGFFKNIEVSPSLLPRFSAGYNAEKWSLGVNFVINRIYISHNNDMDLYFDTGRMNLCFIKRFDSTPKFLKQIKWLNQ
ncbi:DUF4421 domain-containing protein [Parabacteroides sp. OttesenSCG-928-G21]|nr:DUF4421 domain-containing protein [Parabacteroides sp. OttesenSCG-928-G21]